MSKKIDVSLIPRYEGTSAIEYEKIGSTIRKTRLYKFIRVAYSQPLFQVTPLRSTTKRVRKIFFCTHSGV